MSRDEQWMERALSCARRAAALGEVPIGAVIVRDGACLGTGWNRREVSGDVLGHAEIMALRRAARRIGDWRLEGSTLYVTMEPCPMCTGAALQARVARLVYGAPNRRAGAAGTVLSLADYPGLHHQLAVRSGLMAAEAQALLDGFFAGRRGEIEAARRGG